MLKSSHGERTDVFSAQPERESRIPRSSNVEVSVSKPDTPPPQSPEQKRPLNDEVDSHNGNIYYTTLGQFVCQNIRIMAIHHNIDEDAYYFVLAYDYMGQEKVIELPREACLTKRELIKLQRNGLKVTEKTAQYAIEYLINIEQEIPKKLQSNVHSCLGFDVIDGQEVFKHIKAYGIDSCYTGPLDIEAKGDYSTWRNMITNYVLGSPQLEAILTLGFSSAIVGLVSAEFGLDSMLVHISGDSSTGKSISAKLAVSVWGNPSTKISNGLATTWNSTENAIITSLTGNHGLTVLLDEVSMSEADDFTRLIYKLAGSKDKSRLTKEIKVMESGTWATTILTTGEFGLVDKSKKNTGLKIRTLELRNIDWLDSASIAESVNQIILSNYGHAGPKFIEYLLGIGKEEICNTIRQNKYALEGEMQDYGINDSFRSRRAWWYAIILYTAEIVKEALQINLNIQSIKSFFFDLEAQAVQSRDISQTAYDYFVEQYGINFKRFVVSDGTMQPGLADNKAIDIWGKAEHVEGDGLEVNIYTNMFDKIMRQGGYEDPKMILRLWKKKGLLDCENDRLTRTRTIHQDSGKVQVYVVRINNQEAA